jgi:hypothetical protein
MSNAHLEYASADAPLPVNPSQPLHQPVSVDAYSGILFCDSISRGRDRIVGSMGKVPSDCYLYSAGWMISRAKLVS